MAYQSKINFYVHFVVWNIYFSAIWSIDPKYQILFSELDVNNKNLIIYCGYNFKFQIVFRIRCKQLKFNHLLWLQFQIPLNYDAYVICFLVIIPDLFSCFKLHARKFKSHSVGQLISLSVGWLVSQPITSLFGELSGQTESSTCITTSAH